jgi:hypothetical protein
MENAVDALKIAGAVFLFVIALSVAIVSFAQAREASDTIMNFRDRETEYIDGNYYYESRGTERTVSFETILPSIYRAYRENYKVVFSGLSKPLYTRLENSSTEDRYAFDGEYDAIASSDKNAQVFIQAIMYGTTDLSSGSIWSNYYARKVKLPSVSLYEQLQGKTIREYLGVFVTNEVQKEPDQHPSDQNFTSDDNVPDANKQEKRIITYVVS